MNRVLVTGANGFIGCYLGQVLIDYDYIVRNVTRKAHPELSDNMIVADINGQTDWTSVLTDVDCIIHLAARVHVMHDYSSDPLSEFRRVNRDGTKQLAEQASAAGVKKFIYLSSIKVNGELTTGSSFKFDDQPDPQDPYAVSKLEAEDALISVCNTSTMEYVIIRPPLVYGPGVKGNFAKLIKLVRSGIPLPLKSVDNVRSLVSVFNLVDLIVTCLESSAAANRLFLVSDQEDISTSQLLTKLAQAMEVPNRLFFVPPQLFRTVATFLGKRDEAARLLDSLELDITETCRRLNWTPPVSLKKGLIRAVAK